jgi:hypothetical protein
MKKAHFVLGLLIHLSCFSYALGSVELAAQTAPLPVFLRSGFSSVLEFDEGPTRVVLGDGQAFQVERLEKSLVLRTLVPYATSNMFVYFKEGAPKLFILTAAEDAEPTYFRRIESIKAPPHTTKQPPAARQGRAFIPKESRVLSATFDSKKDYLTVEVVLAADALSPLKPAWELARLRYLTSVQSPFKLWSERKDVQKDSAVRARFIFSKPNVPKDLTHATLIIPLEGRSTPLSLGLKAAIR